MPNECRVFIDEFGNTDLQSSSDPCHRYLALSGVIMPQEYATGGFTDALNAIKQEIFGTTNIVLHRREILGAKAPFEALANPAIRQRFDELLLELMATATYRAFTVVIDKRNTSKNTQRGTSTPIITA
jgi:hypothetical protein